MRKIIFLFLIFITCMCFSQSIYNSQQIGQTGRNQNVSRGFWVKSDTFLTTAAVWIPASGGAGKVFTSDANGFGTWQSITSNAWGLTGNSGTNAATNFIGTTDAVDFVLRANNTARLKLKSGGNFTLHGYTGNDSITANGRLVIQTVGSGNIVVNSSNSTTIRSEVNTAINSANGMSNFMVTQQPDIIARSLMNNSREVGYYHNIDTITGSCFSNIYGGRLDGSNSITDLVRIQVYLDSANYDSLSFANGYVSNAWDSTDYHNGWHASSRYAQLESGKILEGGHNDGTVFEVQKDTGATLYVGGFFKSRLNADGSIWLQDGTQGTGKVLTSDANGLATWQGLGGSNGSDIPAYANNAAAFAVLGAGKLYYTDVAGEYIIKVTH